MDGVTVSDLLNGSVLAILTGGGTVFYKNISKKLKINFEKTSELEVVVKENHIVVQKILDCNNIDNQIDEMVRDSLFYIPDDSKLMVLIVELGDLSKDYIKFLKARGIENVTKEEITGRFESISNKLGTLISLMSVEFREMISPPLRARGLTTLARFLRIKEDEIMNTKKKRFILEGLSCIQDCLVIIVKQWIMYDKLITPKTVKNESNKSIS